ncbi:MAG: MarR family transcriptional regulator [Pseudomonadota bacterium]
MFFLKDLPTRAMLDGYAGRYPGLEPDTIGLALARMRWASLLIRAVEAHFAAHGLTQTQFLILIVIDREPDRDTLLPSEIAERLDVSRPIVTNATKRLIGAGLLAYAEPGTDGRAKPLALTAEGRARLAAVLPGYFALISEHMAENGRGGDVTPRPTSRSP